MQTRARTKVQSLSNHVTPLEGSGTRPPSSASDEEGDLGLATMLGKGDVSDAGGDSTWVSATSGLGNTTIVAAQAPISEANVITTHEQTEVDGASSLSLTVSSTGLPATCTQAPIGSLQAAIPSSGGGSEPMYLSAPLHPLAGVEASRIPTLL